MLDKIAEVLVKIKNFLVQNRKKIFSILIALTILVAISVLSMLLLSAFGVVYLDDGIKLNNDLFDDFMSSWYGWVILICLQVIITSLLCFIPGSSMAFILLIQTFFEKPWQAFALAFSGVVLSSVLMYVIGRVGGYRICEILLGEEDCKKASDLLNHKGAIYFPLMMMFPVFPDDALVMIAGTLRMSLKWFTLSIVIGRGIGVAMIIFGLSSIPYDKFTTPLHWIIFIAVCVMLISAVFYATHLFNKFLNERAHKKHEHDKENLIRAEQIYEENKNIIEEAVAEETEQASEIIAELKTANEAETLAAEEAEEILTELVLEAEKIPEETEAETQEVTEEVLTAKESEEIIQEENEEITSAS